MKAKNHKEFKKGIAEKAGVHQDVVDEFITFYYAKVRKALSELSYSSITLFGLGTFHLRKNTLEKAIKKNKSYLGNLSKNTYNGYEKHVVVREKIDSLESIKKILDEVAQEKLNFRNKKNES